MIRILEINENWPKNDEFVVEFVLPFSGLT
jgi:hypothetical protein